MNLKIATIISRKPNAVFVGWQLLFFCSSEVWHSFNWLEQLLPCKLLGTMPGLAFVEHPPTATEALGTTGLGPAATSILVFINPTMATSQINSSPMLTTLMALHETIGAWAFFCPSYRDPACFLQAVDRTPGTGDPLRNRVCINFRSTSSPARANKHERPTWVVQQNCWSGRVQSESFERRRRAYCTAVLTDCGRNSKTHFILDCQMPVYPYLLSMKKSGPNAAFGAFPSSLIHPRH